MLFIDVSSLQAFNPFLPPGGQPPTQSGMGGAPPVMPPGVVPGALPQSLPPQMPPMPPGAPFMPPGMYVCISLVQGYAASVCL